MTIMAKNTVSTGHTGNLVLEANNNRSYFFYTMITGDSTVSFGQVGAGQVTGEIPVLAGEHYQPPVCPTGQIRITTTGTYVVHQG